MNSFLQSIRRKRWPIAILSLVGVVFFGYQGFESWSDYQRFKSGPKELSLSDAVAASSSEQVYARITDPTFDCQHALRDGGKRRRTYVPLLDQSSAVVAVAYYGRSIDCGLESQQPLTGVFSPMEPGLRGRLVEKGMQLGPETRYLCTSCGEKKAAEGVFLCAFFALLSALLYPATLQLERWGVFQRQGQRTNPRS